MDLESFNSVHDYTAREEKTQRKREVLWSETEIALLSVVIISSFPQGKKRLMLHQTSHFLSYQFSLLPKYNVIPKKEYLM